MPEEKVSELGVRWSLAIERCVGVHDKAAIRQRLTVMIQRGCPDSYRGQAWRALTGTEVVLSQDTQVMMSWAGLQPDEVRGQARKIRSPPTFDGPYQLDLLPLSEEGKDATNRVLAAVGMARPDMVPFCPQLPHLVALSLIYMGERAACHIADSIMPPPQDKDLNSGTAAALSNYQVLASEHLLDVMLTALHLKLKQCCPKLMKNMEQLEVSAELIVEAWIKSLFVGHAPLQVSIRAVDVLLCQGLKGLVQYCIGVFWLLQEHLVICLSGEGLKQVLARRLSELYRTEDIMQASIESGSRGKVQVADVDAEVGSLHLHDHDDDEAAHTRNLVYYLPLINPKSEILGEQDIELVWSWLPTRLRVRDGSVVFTSKRDGYNLHQLYTLCQKHFAGGKCQKNSAAPGECLLILRTQGRIIGCFLSDWPRIGAESNLGTGESFVFSIRPTEAKHAWEPGAPSIFMQCRPDSLSIGGSAISIDRYMEKCVSNTSETFGNQGSLFRDPNCEKEDEFQELEIGAVELIGFIEVDSCGGWSDGDMLRRTDQLGVVCVTCD
eukprot:CAMPEP_0184295620 /NCGR_PEP_ID=MMETSP1049-20130417/6468_1 /TAXON_ID=77928 /ORGANISM="Proteomonas sulcata, Strain CCMP704" /LENGTH=550 /DNA_ID=CAMNT_0026604245 /DNA_START=98 /DNA_END=1751 /DNA_ORIENTATION=+